MNETALYIHIPFCSTKCKYCAFSVLTDQSQKAEYLEELKKELLAKLSGETVISTIYFGGGTPSVLRLEEVECLLKHITDNSNLGALKEISFEVNPENVSAEYMEGLKRLGITRISMGMQTLNEHALQIAGRNHTASQALEAMEILNNSGVSWNADLILGLPGQEPEETLDHLETIYTYRPSHFSLYFLSIEAGTEFSLHKKTFFPKEKKVMEIYSKLLHSFTEKNYQQYEISNWALAGHESKHNLMYWKGQNYIGVGLGASSHIDGKIWNNYKNMNLYLQQKDKAEPNSVQVLDTMGKWYLQMMTGIRLLEGIPFKNLEKNINELQKEQLLEIIEQLQQQDLVVSDDNLKLTPKGRLYADFVTEKVRKSISFF